MNFIPAKCPSCGGQLMLPKEREEAICTYCGSKFFLKEAVGPQSGPSMETLFQLAENALRSGNNAEAYGYFTKITEMDANNADAWIGKGIAAGWMSTLYNPKIEEMFSIFSLALDLIPLENPHRKQYESRITETVNQIVQSYYELSYKHMKETIHLGNSSYGKFGDDVGLVLAGVDLVVFFNSKNTDALTLGIQAAKTLAEGEEYESNDGSLHTIRVSPENEAKLLTKMRMYVETMRLIQPDYQPPVFRRKKDSCFIATATMGAYDHPYVQELRYFRDHILYHNRLGSALVRHYYRYSPPLARLIKKNKLLRLVSFYCIVKPAITIARLFR